MKMILIWIILILLILVSAFFYHYDWKLQKRILEFDRQLSEMETTAQKLPQNISENMYLETQLLMLEKRANNLKLCFQCPFYRGKVRKDREQNLLKCKEKQKNHLLELIKIHFPKLDDKAEEGKCKKIKNNTGRCFIGQKQKLDIWLKFGLVFAILTFLYIVFIDPLLKALRILPI